MSRIFNKIHELFDTCKFTFFIFKCKTVSFMTNYSFCSWISFAFQNGHIIFLMRLNLFRFCKSSVLYIRGLARGNTCRTALTSHTYINLTLTTNRLWSTDIPECFRLRSKVSDGPFSFFEITFSAQLWQRLQNSRLLRCVTSKNKRAKAIGCLC